MNSNLANNRADIVVTSPDDSTLLVVEAKRRNVDDSMLRQVEEFARALRAAFVMAVDLQQIVVAPASGGTPDWKRAKKLSTPAILGPYANTSNFDRVEGFYLESLIEVWLRDFAQGWKLKRPPGYEELDSIGLANRLRESQIHAEAHV